MNGGLVAEGLGAALVDPVPARALGGLPIVRRPFRPAGRTKGRLAERPMVHLAAERDAVGLA